MEFLTTFIFTITVPGSTPGQTVDDTKTREAERAHELAEQGHLLRLWTPPTEPGQWRTLGLWRAQDVAEMQAISLPLYVWMTVETTPLTHSPASLPRGSHERKQAEGRHHQAEEFMTQTAPVSTGMAVLAMAQAGCFAEIRDLYAPQLRALVTAGALQAAWAAELSRCGPVSSVAGRARLPGHRRRRPRGMDGRSHPPRT
ncbi:MAG: muconolactone Delta-isomerase family protein [Sciscionella sp.]